MSLACVSYVISCLILLVNKVSGSFTVVAGTIGQTVTLPCTVDFSGKPRVMWLDPDQDRLTINQDVVTSDDRFSVDHPFSNEWNLGLRDVRLSDDGNYTCMIQATPVELKIVELKILSAPTITYSSGNTVNDAGSDVTLQCEAIGIPAPDISWFKYSLTGQKIDLNVRGNYLTLSNISRYDAANYKCEADNRVPPSASSTLRLDVNFAPIVSTPHQHISQELGRDTFLQCVITAFPHQNMWWEKDGSILENNQKYRITEQDAQLYNKSMFLFINDLQEDDFGLYNCFAENTLGKDSGAIELFKWNSGQARIKNPPSDTISQYHSNIRLNCTVENMGHTDSLIWWHQNPLTGHYDKIFESHPYKNVMTHVAFNTEKYEIVGYYDLIVRNVSSDDAGEYSCELRSKRNHTAHVTLVGEPVCSNESPNNTYLETGDVAMLSCALPFTGPTRIWQALWRHNNRKLSSLDEDQDRYMRRTLAFPVFAKDSGVYACVIESVQPVYSGQCSVQVNVIDQEPTPAPLCKTDPWNIATSSLAIIIASCVGGTTLVCLVIMLFICKHYRRKLKVQSCSSPVKNGRNGDIILESTHLTSGEAQEGSPSGVRGSVML